jgi:hypothetical protein
MNALPDSSLDLTPETKRNSVPAIIVFVLCLAYSFVQAPIPGVNEPHYLCKAKHFWQPDYCPGDLFLDSSNTHFVFYVATGWLTKFLSLEATAFIGRLAGLALLASGWTALLVRVSGNRLVPVLSVMFLLASLSFQSFSGEWIVGGIESKVFAYGFIFWAWAFLADGRLSRSAILLGLGTSFHPVVGVWSLIATACSLVRESWKKNSIPNDRRHRWPILFGTYLTLSLPGLIPALITLFEPASDAYAADQIQVFRRLGHHLNPAQFPLSAFWYYALLLVFEWGLNCWFKSRSDRNCSGPLRLWNGIVWGSALVAVVGLIVGFTRDTGLLPAWDPLLVKLMKFYPFRLIDVILPMSVSWKLAALAGSGRASRFVLVSTSIAAFLWCLWIPLPSRNPDRMTPGQRESWVDICRWIDGHLPPDAVLLTPSSPVSFKWYASRASYVTFKDCPQDPAGLLEWERRRGVYKAWASENYSDKRYVREELRELRIVTSAGYLLTSRLGPIESEPIFRNQHYRLYELPAAEE